MSWIVRSTGYTTELTARAEHSRRRPTARPSLVSSEKVVAERPALQNRHERAGRVAELRPD
jgi:hypothetical protein